MRDIRDTLFRYLDIKQHLWNVYFRDLVKDLSECEPLDSFNEIDRRLFYALVAQPISLTLPQGFRLGSDCIDEVLVKPEASSHIDLLVAKSLPPSTYWQRESLNTTGLILSFVDFFQWNKYGFLSCSAVRCMIRQSVDHPEHSGKEAIVESRLVGFFLSDTRAPKIE
jgi:hypothetical protein